MHRIAVGLVVGALLVGCGSGSSGNGLPSTSGRSDEQQIQDLADYAAKALKAKDGDRLCKTMSAQAKAQLILAVAFIGVEPGRCPKMVIDVMDAQPEDEVDTSGKLVNIQIDGAHATAEESNGEKQTFVKTAGGHWLYDVDPDEDDTASEDTETTTSTATTPARAPSENKDLPEITKDPNVGYRMTVADEAEADSLCDRMQTNWPKPGADSISLFSPEDENLVLCAAP